jgi:hypothetical protein
MANPATAVRQCHALPISGTVAPFNMVAVLPIAAPDLPDIAAFLARGFNATQSADAWLRAFRQDWAERPPNYGFMLKDEDRIVGAIGAIYSDQLVHGRRERFCNINNWYVEPDYRRHSILLLSKLLAQPGLHFTNFTPRPDLVAMFLALKFRYVDDGRVTYLLNTPRLPFGRSRVLTGDAALAALPPEEAKTFRDHAACAGLGQVALGATQDGFTHVAFFRSTIKHLPCITVLHVGDPAVLARHLPALRGHFLVHLRAPLTRIDTRLLPARVPLAIELQRPPHTMYLSRSLQPADVTCLYTELAALHAGGAA